MYAGAMIPALLLVGMYLLFVVGVALVKPHWMPALPPEMRIYRESNGASGHISLLALFAICALAGVAWSHVHERIINAWIGRELPAPADETFILSMTVAAFVALALAGLNRLFRLGLLSRLAERVTFVLIPPLVLIFLVLGTIFLGVATPTEGGAMGALGALVMALGRRQLSLKLLKQALDNTAKLATFVMFILIGSTVFQLHLQRRRRPRLGRTPVRQAARRTAWLPDYRQPADLRAGHVHRLLRDRFHRDPRSWRRWPKSRASI